MNQENFKHWFVHQLLLNLRKPSTILLDNASYHITILNKAPTTANKNVEIQEWLRSNNIAYRESNLKPQLLSLVKMNKPKPIYEIDNLAAEYGHEVLRPPPYHCIFNPIENIWGITKNYYRDHVGRKGVPLNNLVQYGKKLFRKLLQRYGVKLLSIQKKNSF
ncbi:hypothetical protein HHI36_003037 [Cryptolaemus montrouzieri]|uniref:Tc1-like transposase DDE domain-containing protein n=1 Tax=Cryptolaemus montrouzieri TaxID=559131 RepID=A0ABD2PCD7_9CUCU